MIDLELRLRDPKTLDTVLASLEPRIARNILRRAMRQAGNVVRDAARQRVPVESGLLKRDIRTVLRRERGGEVRASVGVLLRSRNQQRKQRLEAFYARWVEQGHRIVPRRGRAPASITLRRALSRRTGGRVRPYPFLMPAAEAMQGRVRDVLIAELRRGLVEAIRG